MFFENLVNVPLQARPILGREVRVHEKESFVQFVQRVPPGLRLRPHPFVGCSDRVPLVFRAIVSVLLATVFVHCSVTVRFRLGSSLGRRRVDAVEKLRAPLDAVSKPDVDSLRGAIERPSELFPA